MSQDEVLLRAVVQSFNEEFGCRIELPRYWDGKPMRLHWQHTREQMLEVVKRVPREPQRTVPVVVQVC